MYFDKRGSIDNLKIIRSNRNLLKEDQVEVKIMAIGLNFRDIINILDLYPKEFGNPGPLGWECSGIISRIGLNIKDFKVGDNVYGIVIDCFKDYAIANPDMLIKTESNDFITLASTPLAALTAEYAFNIKTKLEPNMNVLIHAGAGGVGLIATQYALNADCNVYITCSNNKRIYIVSS